MHSSLGEFLKRSASDEGQGRAGSCVGQVLKLVCVLKLEFRTLPSRRRETPSVELSTPRFLGSTFDFEIEPC